MSKFILNKMEHPMFGIIQIAINGDIRYYNANDVAKALGYSNTQKAIRKHVANHNEIILKKNNFIANVDDINNYGVKFINDEGLNELLIDSKLPAAKEFRSWLLGEVVPSIKKTGSYSLDQIDDPNKRSRLEKSLGRKLDEKFKKDCIKCVTKNSIATKKLKGTIWNEFIRTYNLLYGTNLRLKASYIKKEFGVKYINTRELLDILDKKEEALIVFEFMYLSDFCVLDQKHLDRLTELIACVSSAISGFTDMDKVESFVKDNVKRWNEAREEHFAAAHQNDAA